MKAIGKYVVVKQVVTEQASISGIIYTDTSQATLGEVVSTGDEVNNIATGDKIVLNWNASSLVNYGGEKYSIVHVDNIYAVV